MNPASPTPRNGTSVLPDDGGNLARVTCNASSSQTGHSLFCEPASAALPSTTYALIRHFYPLALSAKPYEETPYTD